MAGWWSAGTGSVAALLAILALGFPHPARALSLADVESFRSLNEVLTFSNFDVLASGSLDDLDLGSVEIVLTETGFGFELVGPLSAFDGEIGDLIVRFDVDSVVPLLSYRLSFNGAATEPGSGASVTVTFDGLDEQAFVFATGAGGLRLDDQVDLQGGPMHLRLTADILLDSDTISGLPGSAVISVIGHEFTVVPEPASALLGLLGLAAALTLRRLRA